ncbi:MAG TPA: HD-GYP domain-containing protein [Candidatus Hydrogenedentes bacterium]|nr:HD-GYP domain-containing protein [Candidatus Hydrogenedentota bacterium]HIJ74718.1 HD-GYP domain-containing protein [Candidatus Hydrogenedentota bacterium]
MNEPTEDAVLAKISAFYEQVVSALTSALQVRDKNISEHVSRVNEYSQLVALELGWDASRRKELRLAALLHDIGKIALPDSVLFKKEPLTPDERMQLDSHPQRGAEMLEDVEFLVAIAEIVRHHHERWDGSGYPDGLAGAEIPEAARLLAVVDAFDTMTVAQPYQAAKPAAEAVQKIIEASGEQFDPKMAEAFRRCCERGEIQEILTGNDEAD